MQFHSQYIQADLIEKESIYIKDTNLGADTNKFSFVRKNQFKAKTMS